MNSVIRKTLGIQQHPLCKRHFWNNTEKSLQIRTVLSTFSLIHISCHWGIFGHIWVQICTNLHCLVVVYTLVAVGISLHIIRSVTAISSTRCSPSLLAYSREAVFALREWLLWNPFISDCYLFSSIVLCQSYSQYIRFIHVRVTGVSRSVANLRCWAVTFSLYTYLFPWLSTTISANCLCFDTPSDILVELPCIVKYFHPYEACKTVNWASTYRSC